MIDQLRTARGAYFYRGKARFTQQSVRQLFVDLRRTAENASQPLFRVERSAYDGAVYSAICFSYDRPVPFLQRPAPLPEGEDGLAGVSDRIHGYLLLVERGGMVCLFKSGLDLTAKFRGKHLAPVGRTSVERAIARHDAVFEKLSLRNMSTSRFSLRSKTLEALDLENAITSASATRFIPQGYRVRRPDGSYSATPSTGRIALRSDRADLEGAVRWGREIIDLLESDDGETALFIRSFARAVELARIGDGVRPTYFAIDTMALTDAIFEADDRVRLVREVAGMWHELPKVEVDQVVADLDRPLEVVAGDDELLLMDGGAELGALRVGKARIMLRRPSFPLIDGVFVERAGFAVGSDPDRTALGRFLDTADMFTVLFDDLALVYLNGGLFRDDGLVSGGEAFLKHLLIEAELDGATSEKGTFVDGQQAFTTGSVFRTVVDRVAGEEVLICDDLGDEWADFVGVEPGPDRPAISFYHAKHGARSLSASAFHDSVGQAIKNLGRLSLAGDAMGAKFDGWTEVYRNANAVTAIERFVRGGSRVEIEAKVGTAALAPDVGRRVYIVTSSLSHADVVDAFARAAAGQPVRPHFVQLYWILAGFFQACAEIGAAGFVVCRS